MEIIPPYLRIYQQILKALENAFPFLNVPKPKAGRKPKLTDIQIAAIFILSYITYTKEWDRFLYTFDLRRFYDTTSSKNKNTLQRLPEIGLYLKDQRLFDFLL